MKNKKATIGIIGLGKFGMCLALELVQSGKSIVCIDKEEIKVKKALEFCDYAFVSEDLSKNTLEETGFKECETIVVCIGEHMDTAIFATLNALALGVNKVIAMSNTEEQGLVLEKLGAEVIYPYKDSSDKLAKRILSNDVLDFISLNYEVSGFTYKPYFFGENSTTLILPVNYYVPVGVTSSLTLVYYPDDAATVTDKEQGILRLYLNFRANTDADYSTDYESYALALYGGLGYFNKAYDLGTSAGGGRSILAEWGGSLPSEIRIVVSENPYSTDLENGNTTQHEYEVLSWDEYVDSLPL